MDTTTVKSIVFAIFGVFFYLFTGCGFLLTFLTVFALYAATGGWRFIKVVILTLPRDFRYMHTST